MKVGTGETPGMPARTRRHQVQLPLQIIQLGDQRVNHIGHTWDVTSGGVSFLSPVAIEIGCRILDPGSAVWNRDRNPIRFVFRENRPRHSE